MGIETVVVAPTLFLGLTGKQVAGIVLVAAGTAAATSMAISYFTKDDDPKVAAPAPAVAAPAVAATGRDLPTEQELQLLVGMVKAAMDSSKLKKV